MYGKERSTNICQQLNGRKTLITGNHDDKSVQYYRDCGFIMVCKYPVIYDSSWILSHEPIDLPPDSQFKNIFGHVHIDPAIPTITANSFCVSIERIDYMPIDFESIKTKIEGLSPENH